MGSGKEGNETGELRSEVLRRIKQRYKSLESPTYDFVSEALRVQPYKDLIAELGKLGKLEETTDTNEDLSFSLSIRIPNESAGLRLSMLDRYAVLYWETAEGFELVDGKKPKYTGFVDRIVGLLTEADVLLLDEALLTSPVALRIANTPPGEVHFYQALFTRTDGFPWR